MTYAQSVHQSTSMLLELTDRTRPTPVKIVTGTGRAVLRHGLRDITVCHIAELAELCETIDGEHGAGVSDIAPAAGVGNVSMTSRSSADTRPALLIVNVYVVVPPPEASTVGLADFVTVR